MWKRIVAGFCSRKYGSCRTCGFFAGAVLLMQKLQCNSYEEMLSGQQAVLVQRETVSTWSGDSGGMYFIIITIIRQSTKIPIRKVRGGFSLLHSSDNEAGGNPQCKYSRLWEKNVNMGFKHHSHSQSPPNHPVR